MRFDDTNPEKEKEDFEKVWYDVRVIIGCERMISACLSFLSCLFLWLILPGQWSVKNTTSYMKRIKM